MANSTPPRSLLKASIFWLIIIITIFIWSSILRSCSPAPGAQDAPVNSRSGKVDCQHPGGRFYRPSFFEHNVFFSNWYGAKLIPNLSRLPACNTIIPNYISFLTHVSCAIYHINNYITVGTTCHAIYSLAPSYPQSHIVIHIPGIGIHPELGDILISRTTELVSQLKN